MKGLQSSTAEGAGSYPPARDDLDPAARCSEPKSLAWAISSWPRPYQFNLDAINAYAQKQYHASLHPGWQNSRPVDGLSPLDQLIYARIA